MLSSSIEIPSVGKAESELREAFMRLRSGKPRLLKKGTRVTQDNVAREAGKDPSALKKKRFPNLIGEIQRWVETEAVDPPIRSPRQEAKAARARSKQLKERLELIKNDRDNFHSLLLSAQHELLELWREVLALRAEKASNVLTLTTPKLQPTF